MELDIRWRETQHNDVRRRSSRLHHFSHLIENLTYFYSQRRLLRQVGLLHKYMWWMWSCLPIHQLSYISFMFPNTLFFFFLLLCSPTDIFISLHNILLFKSWIQPKLISVCDAWFQASGKYSYDWIKWHGTPLYDVK